VETVVKCQVDCFWL